MAPHPLDPNLPLIIIVHAHTPPNLVDTAWSWRRQGNRCTHPPHPPNPKPPNQSSLSPFAAGAVTLRYESVRRGEVPALPQRPREPASPQALHRNPSTPTALRRSTFKLWPVWVSTSYGVPYAHLLDHGWIHAPRSTLHARRQVRPGLLTRTETTNNDYADASNLPVPLVPRLTTNNSLVSHLASHC